MHLPVGTPGTGAMMRAKAKQTYSIPGSNRTRVAAETMRGWIADYRRGSFDALYPKPRTDRGKPRRLPAEVVERLIALKTGNPGWSVHIAQGHRQDNFECPRGYDRDRLRATLCTVHPSGRRARREDAAGKGARMERTNERRRQDIWTEQCEAAGTLRVQHPVDSAFEQAVGEKILDIAEAKAERQQGRRLESVSGLRVKPVQVEISDQNGPNLNNSSSRQSGGC